MVRKITIIVCAVMLVGSVCTAFAQGPPSGRWWRRPRIAKALNLSESEKQKLDDLFVRSRRKLIRLKNKVEEERFELENFLEQEPLDKEAVMAQFHNLDKARSQLAEERFRFLLGVREIVGYERFQRLKDMYRRFHRRRRLAN